MREVRDKITEHFTVWEAVRSDAAARLKIDNFPKQEKEWDNIKQTCMALEKVRVLLGNRPIIITSFYRCYELNCHPAIGSKPTSAHIDGRAVDFECIGLDNNETYDIIQAHKEEIQYDQLIREFEVYGQPMSGWIHLGFAEASVAPRLMAFRFK